MLRRLIFKSLWTFAFVACLPTIVLAQSSVAWRTNLDQARVEAAQSRRLLLVHFTTKKCGPCKLLDQQVFSQPQVGPTIEQNYVPVRLDADENQAWATKFRIDRVPTEIIMTPEGEVLVNPPIPDKADAYLAQLQNIARHFQQSAGTAGASAPTAPPADLNSAYANLPMSASAGAQPGQSPAPQVINNPAMQQPQLQPQTQVNPFANGAANPGVYGQAQNVYAAPAPQPQIQPQQQATPQHQSAAAASPSLAAQPPVMPSNAMPRSFRPPAPDAAAATVAAATATRPQAELPAGSPPLAFDGFCPVSLKTLNRWAEGNAQFGAVHRGRTYLFAGAEQRDQFLANPDSFSPVFAGLDPVLLIEKQQSVEGSRALGYRYGDSFYLFSSEETKQKFASSPHTYAAGVRQAMNRIDAGNGSTIRR